MDLRSGRTPGCVCLLPVRDRDTVSGDLMEEYRETVRPGRSRLAADAWYVGQVSRFAWRPALWGVRPRSNLRRPDSARLVRPDDELHPASGSNDDCR